MIAAPERLTIRAARASETAVLEALIARSARALGRGFYSDAETEAAVAHVFGVDSELVEDGSYYVVEDGSRIIACGGWSARSTLFGADHAASRRPGRLDPATDAARIRAFFVDPDIARSGIGTRLLAHCEAAARAAGFARAALMATRPGEPFYTRHGYVAAAAIAFDAGGTTISFIPMEKRL